MPAVFTAGIVVFCGIHRFAGVVISGTEKTETGGNSAERYIPGCATSIETDRGSLSRFCSTGNKSAIHFAGQHASGSFDFLPSQAQKRDQFGTADTGRRFVSGV
jgi:hypothetical protein